MKKIYALQDKIDDSLSSHFIGGENVSDLATLRSVRAQFKDHYAVNDLTLVCVGDIDENGIVIGYDYVNKIGELCPNAESVGYKRDDNV